MKEVHANANDTIHMSMINIARLIGQIICVHMRHCLSIQMGKKEEHASSSKKPLDFGNLFANTFAPNVSITILLIFGKIKKKAFDVVFQLRLY